MKSTLIKVADINRIYLNWTEEGLWPITPSNELGVNNCHSVFQIGDEYLEIVTTEGYQLIYIKHEKEIK